MQEYDNLRPYVLFLLQSSYEPEEDGRFITAPGNSDWVSGSESHISLQSRAILAVHYACPSIYY